MKIALLADLNEPLYEGDRGEKSDFVYLIIKGLRQMGHDVFVFASPDSKIDGDMHSMTAEAIDWQFQEDISEDLKQFLIEQHAYNEVFNILNDREIDLTLNFTNHPWPISNARFLGGISVHYLKNLPRPALQSAVQLNKNNQNYFVCSDYHLQNMWSSHVQISEVIASGIDVEVYPFSNVPEDNRAVWIGDIERGSGIKDALEACQQNLWNLCIIGEVKDQDYFEYIIEPYLGSETFVLHPEKDNLKCENYLKRSEVAIFTQKHCSILTNVLKCLSHGIPVVTYPIKSLEEFLPDGIGKQTKTENIAELAHIGKIACGFSRQKCHDFVKQYYNTHVQARQFNEFIEHILNSKISQKEKHSKFSRDKSLL